MSIGNMSCFDRGFNFNFRYNIHYYLYYYYSRKLEKIIDFVI